MTSWGLWIPLLWIAIIGSRPVSLWFGGGIHVETPEDYLDGSPIDRNVFMILIIIGLMILIKRRINWMAFFAANRILILFILYLGISVIWSDYPFVSFKRWIKDFGNVVMILIVLTEIDPLRAITAVFSRFANFAIPLSILFIKYFPQFGRYYNRWTWEPVYSGVTTGKNGLGAIVLICGLFLVWDLVRMLSVDNKKSDNIDLLARIVLLLMVLWLIIVANSATSLVSLILGVGILIYLRSRSVAMRRIKFLGTWTLVLGFFGLLTYSVPSVFEVFTNIVDRDITLTGRTELWADLLRLPNNPIFGAGYDSFWLGPYAERLWEKYSFHPNQAHNGYLETYLNGGLIGISLLVVIIVFTVRRLKKELLRGSNFAIFCFPFFIVMLIYNWTEAMFNKMSLVWVCLLMTLLWLPDSTGSAEDN